MKTRVETSIPAGGDGLRRLAAPAALLLAGTLAVWALTDAVWLGLAPSPLTGGLRRWIIPPNWNPAGIAPPGGTLAQPAGVALALFAGLLVALAGAAWWAARRATGIPAGDRRLLWAALGMAAALGTVWLLLPALPSDDIFSYILYGRIGALAHANPLVTTPAQFPGDPFLHLVFWQTTRAVYGPAWLLVSDGLTWLAQALGGRLAAYVALYKLLGLACHLLNALLIWGILSRWAPERRLVGTILYAWNPLPLLEFAASGHNDALMLTGLLLGLWLLARGQERPALVAWGAAIAVKYVALALVPLWLWGVALAISPLAGEGRGQLLARRMWAAGWRGGIVLGVAAILAAPFWAGPGTLAALVASPPAQQLGNSLLDTLQWPLRWLAMLALHLAPGAARNLVVAGLKLAGLAGFAAVWLWQLARRAARDFLGAWHWALLAYLILASGLFWPWYVSWPLVLAALRPADRATTATFWLAGGALALYGVLPLMAAPVFGYRALIVFLPALGSLAGSLWRARMGQRGDCVTAPPAPRLGSIERI